METHTKHPHQNNNNKNKQTQQQKQLCQLLLCAETRAINKENNNIIINVRSHQFPKQSWMKTNKQKQQTNKQIKNPLSQSTFSKI